MRKFKTDSGEVVDLDDPSTYANLPDNLKELEKLMFAEIGMAHWYVNYLHWDIDGYEHQMKRVDKLNRLFTEQRRDHFKDTPENRLWYMEQIYIYRDETENMC